MIEKIKHISSTSWYIYSTLFLVSIGMYLPTFYSTRSILLGCILLLPHFEIHRDYKKLLYSSFGMFLLVAIGQLYTDYPKEAFKELEVKVMLGALPLFAYLTKSFWISHLHKFKQVFILISSIVCIYLLGRFINMAFLDNPQHAAFSYFYTYHNYSAGVLFHATYLSLYICLAAFFLIEETKDLNRLNKWLTAPVFILFSWTILLCMSRVTIIILIPITGIYLLKQFKTWIGLSIIGAALLSIILFAVTTKNNFIFDRFERIFTRELAVTDNSRNPDDPVFPSRFERWGSAIDVFKKAPIIGHGAGSEIGELTIEYDRSNMYFEDSIIYNAHNQYLSVLIQYGIIGFALLLFHIVATFMIVKKPQKELWSFWVINIMLLVAFITENMLGRQKGILLYSLGAALLLILSDNKKTSIQQNRQ